MFRIICSCCGRDINAIGQDNMSYTNSPLCEDCFDIANVRKKMEEEYARAEEEYE